MRSFYVGLSLFVCAVALAAADAPYAGKWKLNLAKSDFGSFTLTYAQLPSGEMQATLDGQSYKFKMDGQDYPDPFGNTAAWKSIDANTWQTDWKLNGKKLYTDTVKLSPDGKTLNVVSTGTKPNGEELHDTATFRRVSGGPGLSGKWQARKFNSAAPGIFELAPDDAGGLTIRMLDVQMTCAAKLDGKDYPCEGPTMGPGWTVAYFDVRPRSLGLLVKKDGKPMYKYVYTVSADNKTLIETGGATATKEKLKIVYDRQ